MTMAVESVAQERLSKRFDKWDANGDGVLEPSDFVTEAADIARGFGEAPDSPKAVELKNGFLNMFEQLADKAGVSKQGPISREQFIQVTAELVQGGEAAFNPVLAPVAKSLVALADRDGDGSIDIAEFASWLQALGLGEAQAREAFQQVDTDGSGTLDEAELLTVIREFHFGNLEAELLG
ncbi:EF-hand domain-containing protein [Streptomyces nitrosporeus]|uniref:EF-hand domain-containing protein n=2 Tax=Streptomyces nitrosporeus TaxID=28894 RepID=A0A5J6FHF0_9ACTN|nr:EF-hand domain-containing protein [Streptomyces nitrosporeus]QEU75778.1 EF-hand domain-containing protein [Streptomyces nitrosporeus]GGY88066.1 hypothetical protein GCM10010327_18470 [Streptomyces nitrosporeus]